MVKKVIITDEQFEKAYRIAATIVRDHGDKYLPVFKRIEEERKKRSCDLELLKLALQSAYNEIG